MSKKIPYPYLLEGYAYVTEIGVSDSWVKVHMKERDKTFVLHTVNYGHLKKAL